MWKMNVIISKFIASFSITHSLPCLIWATRYLYVQQHMDCMGWIHTKYIHHHHFVCFFSLIHVKLSMMKIHKWKKGMWFGSIAIQLRGCWWAYQFFVARFAMSLSIIVLMSPQTTKPTSSHHGLFSLGLKSKSCTRCNRKWMDFSCILAQESTQCLLCQGLIRSSSNSQWIFPYSISKLYLKMISKDHSKSIFMTYQKYGFPMKKDKRKVKWSIPKILRNTKTSLSIPFQAAQIKANWIKK